MKLQELIKSKKRSIKYRKRILELSQKVSALHLGGTFSCTEIMDLIFNVFLNKKNLDCFVMSKGHGSILHYVILEDLGVLKKKDVENYCKPNGFLGVHPDRGNPGINASTGSLGHGLSMSVGMALAEKGGKAKRIIYSVLSDGELQEGSTWEAIMIAPSLNVNNLVTFIDNNDLQSLERTSKSHPYIYPIEDKLKSFGWQSYVCDGHNQREIFNAFKKKKKNKPLAIICKTIKGYPISYMSNKPIWHYKSPNKEEYLKALKELDNTEIK